jgi:hypothetical protein
MGSAFGHEQAIFFLVTWSAIGLIYLGRGTALALMNITSECPSSKLSIIFYGAAG